MTPAAAVMPPSTAALFARLNHEPLLAPFTLIGGTALALHLAHRRSEDLDFITTGEKLPRAALDQLAANLRSENHALVTKDDPAAYDDFVNAGLSLHDHSQTWLVDDSVKLTFFTADFHHKNLLGSSGGREGFGIASLAQLCDLKAIVAASRSKSRDWLDLYLLERDHGYGLKAWKQAYDRAALTDAHFETALDRICRGTVPPGDEGFDALLPDPPSLEDIAGHFRRLRRDYEVETARRLRPEDGEG